MTKEPTGMEQSIEAIMHLIKSIKHSSLSRLEFNECLRLLGSTNDPKEVTSKLNAALNDLQQYLGLLTRLRVQQYLSWAMKNVKNPQAVPLDVLKELYNRSEEILAELEKKLEEKRSEKML